MKFVTVRGTDGEEISVNLDQIRSIKANNKDSSTSILFYGFRVDVKDGELVSKPDAYFVQGTVAELTTYFNILDQTVLDEDEVEVPGS